MYGDFDGFEFEPFQYLQAGIKCGRFDCNQVTWLGDSLKTEVQGLQCPVGDQQFFHRQHQSADHVAQGNLPSQLRVAGRQIRDRHPRVHGTAGAGQ